ncbi:ATP-binding protein, partial [Actinocatenispora rupis]
GQAHVKGVSGTWQDLTENVNQLASTLTTQLRAIAEVSTAVTRGDLTRTVAVEAMGEVAELKDNINQMIVTLRDTTKKNAEQDWMNSNLARVSALLQGQRDIGEVCRMIMNEVTPLVNAQVGAFFMHDLAADGTARLRLTSSYGYVSPGTEVVFAPGEGLVGQAVLSRRTIRITGTPEGYLTVRSGLGTAPPSDVVVLPVIFEGEPLGVIEFASFGTFSDLHLTFLDRLVTTIAIALNTILANRRTEELLAQSQRLAREMQDQSAELQRTNAELEEKATALAEQKQNIEVKNREIEMARLGLEEKAQQLARASQYKSEFLANMSHELRTPLNSLLLLARMLADNPERNLSEKQIEFARTIHSSGSELLVLINDILDLSKVEAGRMDVQPAEVPVAEVTGYVRQAFRPQVQEKGLDLEVVVDPAIPERLITDAQRLQQILRNLLSNAVKFTEPGGRVSLTVAPTPADTMFGVPSLDDADETVSFAVSDTGIGIPEDKLQLIFDAFQQADGTTSRKYGGTGLGLSISREAAKLLGGMITVRSEPGEGSTFTLTIPAVLPAETAAALSARPSEPWKPVSVQEAAKALVPIMAPAPELPTGERKERDSAPDLTGIRVLIVDDDIRNVYALSSALEMHGMTVVYADNGSDGVRKLTEEAPVDIVLMDAMMPEMDGYETTRTIRESPEFADLPIVFLTAKAMPGDRDKSLAAGASDYIAKPVDLDELLDLMASWLPNAKTDE